MQQPWLILFSDMMTLMLTFFVIMVAMSVIDENSRQRAVESVRHVFGFQENKFLLDKPDDAVGVVRPGVSRREDATRHDAAQLVAADDPDATIRFTDTELIISLQGDLLFAEGGVSLSQSGKQALDRIVPALRDLEHTMLIAGYSAPGVGEGAMSGLGDERVVDPGWTLSMERTLAVYKYFTGRGVDKAMLRMEAYGSHRPRFSDNTSEGRRKNRRVDLVLDKKSPGIRGAFESLKPLPGQSQEYFFRDFRFHLGAPGGESESGGNN